MPRHRDDLTEHACVNFRFQGLGQPARWAFRIGHREVGTTPSARAIVDEGNAVMMVLIGGGGISVSPTYIAAPYVARGELVPILTQFVVQRSSISALWPTSRRGSPNVKAFLSFLSEGLLTPAPWGQFAAS